MTFCWGCFKASDVKLRQVCVHAVVGRISAMEHVSAVCDVALVLKALNCETPLTVSYESMYVWTLRVGQKAENIGRCGHCELSCPAAQCAW